MAVEFQYMIKVIVPVQYNHWMVVLLLQHARCDDSLRAVPTCRLYTVQAQPFALNALLLYVGLREVKLPFCPRHVHSVT